MATIAERPIDEAILQVPQHLGIAQAHVAARVRGDWQALATTHLETIASLPLVYLQGMKANILFSRPLTGKYYDLIDPLLGFTRTPDRHDPFHCKQDPHPLRHDNDSGTALERDEGRKVSRHGAMIMR
jgi:hypothetical protein